MPQILDIFNEDAFSVVELSKAIDKLKPVPTALGDSGLFPTGTGVTTTTVSIEQREGSVQLVDVKPRGSSGSVPNRTTRKIRALSIPHLPQRDTVRADEVQNVRAFGSATQVEAVSDLVVTRLAKLRQNIDYTLESHRLLALKGICLDANGNDIDLAQFFGVTRRSQTMNFSAANFDLRGEIFNVIKLLKQNDLKGVTNGGTVFCGDNFWEALIKSKSVKETYLNWQAAADLRQDPTNAFTFAGVKYQWYDGNSEVGIDPNAAIFVPNIRGIFDVYYAPADYMETVNTVGQGYYAKLEPMDFGKGIEIEAQSNPLVLNTCPQGIVDLVLA